MTAVQHKDRALVVLLPERISAAINPWRRAHDPNYDIVPAHITVAYPPFIPEEQWPSQRSVVRRCLGRFRPFRIVLHGLGDFETESHVLWLQVEDGGWLSRIRAVLMQCVPQYMPPLPFEYVPHVTIGVFDSPADLAEVRDAMRAQIKPRRFTVRRLTYLSPDEQGIWCVCSQIALGSGD